MPPECQVNNKVTDILQVSYLLPQVITYVTVPVMNQEHEPRGLGSYPG